MTILSAAVMLFLIMDPLGNLPIFLSVLKTVPVERRQKIIVRELFFALIVMLIFLFAGRHILQFLHLRQEAVSISGGIILFLIALKMIFPGRGGALSDDEENEEPFLVPLAIPMVAGPSLLAALMLITNSGEGTMMDWVIALLAAWSLTAVILYFSNVFFKMLGHRGLIAMERLMGMILVMISVQMFLDGIINYWPNT